MLNITFNTSAYFIYIYIRFNQHVCYSVYEIYFYQHYIEFYDMIQRYVYFHNPDCLAIYITCFIQYYIIFL